MVHGRGVVFQRRQPRARLLAQGLALVGRGHLDRGLEHADDLARALGALVVQAQEVERARPHVAGRAVVGDDALEELARRPVVLGLGQQRTHGFERARWLVQIVEPASGDAQPALLALLGPLILELRFPERDEIAPALVALEQALQRALELDVTGLERHQLLQVADRLVGLIGDVLGHLRGLLQELDTTRVVVGVLQRVIVEREHLIPALQAGEHHREPLERPLGVGVDLQDTEQDVLARGRVVAEPLLDQVGGPLAEGNGQLHRQVPGQHRPVQRSDLVGAIELVRERLDDVPTLQISRGFLYSVDSGIELVADLLIGHLSLGAAACVGNQDIMPWPGRAAMLARSRLRERCRPAKNHFFQRVGSRSI